jgi:hypothetical protein
MKYHRGWMHVMEEIKDEEKTEVNISVMSFFSSLIEDL